MTTKKEEGVKGMLGREEGKTKKKSSGQILRSLLSSIFR
jgi:hypothetical protein